jgi:hypothetical protein
VAILLFLGLVGAGLLACAAALVRSMWPITAKSLLSAKALLVAMLAGSGVYVTFAVVYFWREGFLF